VGSGDLFLDGEEQEQQEEEEREGAVQQYNVNGINGDGNGDAKVQGSAEMDNRVAEMIARFSRKLENMEKTVRDGARNGVAAGSNGGADHKRDMRTGREGLGKWL